MTSECAICGATGVPLKHSGATLDLLCGPCREVTSEDATRRATTADILEHRGGPDEGLDHTDPVQRRGVRF